MKPTPLPKVCFLCRSPFLAEWARSKQVHLWHISEICLPCEERLRERAAS